MLPPHRPFKDKPVKRKPAVKKKPAAARPANAHAPLDPVSRGLAPRRMIMPAPSPVFDPARKDKLISVKSKALTD